MTQCLLLQLVFIVAFALASAGSASAQDSEFQLWNAVLATANLESEAPSFSLWMDTHVRRGNAGTVHIARPGVGSRISGGLSFWAGYAWVPVYPDDAFDPRDEHRLWQQVILSHREGPLALQSRTRFEQRFVEGGDEVGLRVRQFVRASWQFTSGPAPGVGVVLWDEIFVGLNDADFGQPQGLDQNRLFFGAMFALNDWARLEPGYLFVYLDRDSGDRIAHALSINLFLSPTL